MNNNGKIIFWIGVSLAVIMGAIVSYDPGVICKIDSNNLPDTIWSYPALCFTFWAFSVPVGLIIAAIGVLIYTKADNKSVLKFGLGAFGVFIFISIANGPIPHVPVLFGIGGTLLLLFYFLILWKNANKLKENIYKLAGYTFLLIGFWFTCGLGSRQYQPLLGDGESPIDIMIYFVLAMFCFWLGEKNIKSPEK
ncbi:hypothetical protein E9993_14945 [Labilibacter sediminis]|nr:hypothetical protein E9993_14945 [Labilibacter sediminis]